MNFYAELHRLRRRVTVLERRTKPYEVRVEVSPKAVDLKAIQQLIGRRNNPPKTDDMPRDARKGTDLYAGHGGNGAASQAGRTEGGVRRWNS